MASQGRPILFVDHATGLGGAERSLLLLLSCLGNYGWQAHLACPPEALSAAAREAGTPVHALTLPRLRRSARFVVDLLAGARALASLAADVKAEALYANTVRAATYCALASKLTGYPFIWHMRDFWLSEEKPDWLAVDRLGKRLILAASNGVIANSKAVASNLPGSDLVRVVLNGIDLGDFSGNETGGAFRATLGVPQQAPLIGTVGRLRPWKGQHRFLRIARQVLEGQADVYFVIAGGSPLTADEKYAAHLKALVRELDLQERVFFTGQLADVRPVLAALDIFVHAGDPEPFGLVNVEAMAMGLPVVAFSHGALPEIVEEGVTGHLAPSGDEDAMARAVLGLLSDPGLRSRMGQAGQARVARHFSIERTVTQIDVALRSFLDKRV